EKVYELFSMIQPINHGADAEAIKTYRVEPYVMVADVYANQQHKGRGGWTWYTGSAGWMYQFIVESLIGLQLKIDRLTFSPCFPLDWPEVQVTYRFKSSTYRIKIYQIDEKEDSRWKIGDTEGKGNSIQLSDDGKVYDAEVYVAI